MEIEARKSNIGGESDLYRDAQGNIYGCNTANVTRIICITVAPKLNRQSRTYTQLTLPEGGLMWKSSTAFLQDIV